MTDNGFELLTVFTLAYIFKRCTSYNSHYLKFLVTIVVNFSLPALIYLGMINVTVNSNIVLKLALLGLFVPLILLVLAQPIARNLKLDNKTKGVFLSSVTIANLSFFLYPLIGTSLGALGVAHLAMYDIGNTVFAYSANFLVAIKHSNVAKPSFTALVKQLASFPPLIAITFSLVHNLVNSYFFLSPPDLLYQLFEVIRGANAFLAMLILGFSFQLKVARPRITFSIVMIRMLGGLTLGFLASTLMRLEGIPKLIAIAAPAMPVGVSSLLYAIKYDLDIETASSAIAVSILVGFLGILFYLVFGPAS